MATFSGKSGIAALKQKILDKNKQLMQEAVQGVMENLVDNTPVGDEAYMSKTKGVILE